MARFAIRQNDMLLDAFASDVLRLFRRSTPDACLGLVILDSWSVTGN